MGLPQFNDPLVSSSVLTWISAPVSKICKKSRSFLLQPSAPPLFNKEAAAVSPEYGFRAVRKNCSGPGGCGRRQLPGKAHRPLTGMIFCVTQLYTDFCKSQQAKALLWVAVSLLPALRPGPMKPRGRTASFKALSWDLQNIWLHFLTLKLPL